jgi:hypothetical protein
MTNAELLNVRSALNIAANGAPAEAGIDYVGAQTTAVRYAIIQNQKRLQDALEVYQEMLQDLIEEHDVELESRQIPEDAPDAFSDALDELLQTETPFEAYTVSDEDIKQEPNVPIELLMALDWMIDDA